MVLSVLQHVFVEQYENNQTVTYKILAQLKHYCYIMFCQFITCTFIHENKEVFVISFKCNIAWINIHVFPWADPNISLRGVLTMFFFSH